MAERINLGIDPETGADQWVVFRDLATMSNRQRRPYMDLLFKMQNGKWRPDEDAESAWKWGAASTFMLIGGWSREEEIPTDFDLFELLLEDIPVSFVDPMMLEVSQFLMGQVRAIEDPPTKRARKPAAKTTASLPESP